MARMQVYTLADLVGMKDDPDRWIVQPVIQRSSRVILYGYGNLGKSFVALDLAIAMAIDDAWMGVLPVAKPGPVLVCSTEGDIYANRDRILWLCNEHGYVDYGGTPFWFMQDSALLDQHDDQREFAAIVEHVRPRLVILDPLDSFFTGEENSASQTKPFRRYVDNLIRAFGCTVMMLHHEADGNTKSDRKRPRGTTAWHGWADTVLHVEGRPGKLIDLTMDKQRNGAVGHFGTIALDVDPMAGTVRFRPQHDIHADGNLTASILALLQAGPQPIREIRRVLHGTPGALVLRALEQLQKLGRAGRCQVEVSSSDGDARVLEGWRLLDVAGIRPPDGGNGEPLH